MARVAWSAEALRGVEEIYDWIAADKPLAAEAFAEAILNAGNSLEMLPERGRRTEHDWRELTVVRPIVIRYRYDVTDDLVTIIAVWHGARGSAP